MPRRLHEEEIRVGRVDFAGEIPRQPGGNALAARADFLADRPHPFIVVQRRQGYRLAGTADAVRIAQLPHRFQELGPSERIADAHTGQPERLGHAPRDDDVVVLPHQGQSRGRGKVHVGLVHHHQPRALLRQTLDLLRRGERAGWRIRIRDCRQRGPHRRQFIYGHGKVFARLHRDDLRVLHVRPHFVIRIGGKGVGYGLSPVYVAAKDEVQNLVGAVIQVDPIDVDFVDFG